MRKLLWLAAHEGERLTGVQQAVLAGLPERRDVAEQAHAVTVATASGVDAGAAVRPGARPFELGGHAQQQVLAAVGRHELGPDR